MSAAGVIAERFRERLESAAMSQAGLARKIGVSQATVAKLANGESYGSKHLYRMARELGTTTEYLVGETDDPEAGLAPTPPAQVLAEQLDLVPIQELQLSYGMGGTCLDNGHVEAETIHFPRKWLQAFTRSDPQHLFFARGDGDSMVPTIFDQDIILVDRAQATIDRQDRIWAIAYGEIGMVKRLRAMPGGTYKIMSDNAAVSDESAADDEMFVIGRVVAIIRQT